MSGFSEWWVRTVTHHPALAALIAVGLLLFVIGLVLWFGRIGRHRK